MMSKKQWFVLLCVYIIYLCLGASVFYELESREEELAQEEDRKERKEIEGLLVKHYVPNEEHTQADIFEKLTSYCGKPLSANMSDIEPPLKWDFYHSLFFVITVVSTIGYGNLAPTTACTRIFMIFYGIIGIPMNGIVIITLGEFFGNSFLKLYDRWKTLRVQHALATLGLVGQIVIYLIPGFTFFIFLPSILIMVYEGWTYDVAVSYAFVTLTTIGFGDYVAGTHENDFGHTLYMAYKIFLLVWIISGLGYILMVLGFVSRGMRSKKMHALEHKIAHNLKKTNNKIRDELRTVLNEYLLLRVKRVYREKFVYVPTNCQRRHSCPDLTIWRNMESPTMVRKRALSECATPQLKEIARIQSDSDLERIDKEKTFKPSAAIVEPSQLLLRVVNALGNYETLHSSSSSGSTSNMGSRMEGVDMFASNEILACERYGSKWSVANHKISVSGIPPRMFRPRAASECKQPLNEKPVIKANDLTWYGPAATKRLQELREKVKDDKSRFKTLPFVQPVQNQSILSRLRNTFKSSKDDHKKNVDLERQEVPDFTEDQARYLSQTQERRCSDFSIIEKDRLLEETSIADFLRALTAISVPELMIPPKRKLGTASLTPPEEEVPKGRSVGLPTSRRRASLIPTTPTHDKHRRFSLRPESPSGQGDFLSPPPPYSRIPEGSRLSDGRVPEATNLPSRIIAKNRRFSLRPVSSSATASPVQRHAMKVRQQNVQEVSYKKDQT